ncbi:MAG: hypothetical protein RJB39_636 [Candidatus Parcubacteria bacterium]|jgi:FKBP-type peptidyl-prolyl cis-trans isomerase
MNKKTTVWIIVLVIIIALAVYFLNKKTDNTMESAMTNANTTQDKPLNPAEMASSTRVAQNGDVVIVNYTGTLKNGTKFDSSYDRGQPFGLILGKGMVIPGWEEGLIGMKQGEKKHLVIPAAKAYGAQEIKGDDGKIIIPKNSTLVFDVEVLQVIPADKVEQIMAAQAKAQAQAATK